MAKLVLVIEIGLVDDTLEVVSLGKPADNLVDLIADFLIALKRYHFDASGSQVQWETHWFSL